MIRELLALSPFGPNQSLLHSAGSLSFEIAVIVLSLMSGVFLVVHAFQTSLRRLGEADYFLIFAGLLGIGLGIIGGATLVADFGSFGLKDHASCESSASACDEQ